ncbi:MAG TPA: type IV toxin-antitoxin system AbiEi family antitoxin domain-containing protein [Acidimicrobiales bacterium]|nr:type IV toxin-antitoxin system AbiEi family antitoxin domain-containing protein [Acidimicrobiales bacterium]
MPLVPPSPEEQLEWLARHHGVMTRAQALGLGLTARQIQWRLERRWWVALHPGVYSRAVPPPGPEARTLAACLAHGAGAVASHRSAAYLWDLLTKPPAHPTLTVLLRSTSHLRGVEIRRRDDLDPRRAVVRGGIPVTDPLRTLADLGADASEGELG